MASAIKARLPYVPICLSRRMLASAPRRLQPDFRLPQPEFFPKAVLLIATYIIT